MTRSKQLENLVAVAGGFGVLGMAMILLWHRMCAAENLMILGGMYVPTVLGVSVGYHRLLAHRAFETSRPIKYLFAILGSMAVQGPVLEWVSDHRKHHAYADREGDPHSPHVGYSGGWWGALRGLWHAHVGWVFRTQGEADREVYSRDLLQDPGIVLINRGVGVFVLLTFIIPFVLGYTLTATLYGGWTALFWGGFVRVFLLHHTSFSINSLCHYFGSRRFRIEDLSGNVLWLSLLSFGESWHHNHHAFPRSAFHGLRWWELDISGLVIRAMQWLGLVWDVVEIPRAVQQRKEALSPTTTP